MVAVLVLTGTAILTWTPPEALEEELEVAGVVVARDAEVVRLTSTTLLEAQLPIEIAREAEAGVVRAEEVGARGILSERETEAVLVRAVRGGAVSSLVLDP